MPRPTKDLTGKCFGLLIVLQIGGVDSGRNVQWKCRCQCGRIKLVRGTHLSSGQTKSCGCLVGPSVSAANIARLTKHGLSKTLTGESWFRMMQRCLNPKAPDYYRYGARGIVPCDGLRQSPTVLLHLIGERPSREYTLDRIDNMRGYECGCCAECLSQKLPCNVRWATRKQQGRNCRNNRLLTVHGITMPLSQLVEETGVPRSTIINRISHGQSPEQAIRKQGNSV